ncbi:MAG: hypothetical protein EZS28_052140 [Streblomastix strix]|uniref:Histidine kinase/HSP90-like ATPase domain-containing protein n=1 Tax=Streblomastix strix TaxID=222440 RepID=A0A5J4SHM9_9EUKA|nr:MAG: hypothetical protein EZS28_052140 [Streblomastix strix]
MGIEEDEIQHVIEYGVGGSNAAIRRSMGGGFGLTKAYYFSKQFNGSFTVRSAVGVGSTFIITIPCPTQFHVIHPYKNYSQKMGIQMRLLNISVCVEVLTNQVILRSFRYLLISALQLNHFIVEDSIHSKNNQAYIFNHWNKQKKKDSLKKWSHF